MLHANKLRRQRRSEAIGGFVDDYIGYGFFDDPMDTSRLEFKFYTRFQECLLPFTVDNEEVVLDVVLDDHPTVYNTAIDRFFDFWTDGRTVAAILYVQDSYDTYDWDAEVYVNGVNKHYRKRLRGYVLTCFQWFPTFVFQNPTESKNGDKRNGHIGSSRKTI